MNEEYSDTHRFLVDVAVDVGINAAIVLYDICYWCLENERRGLGFSMYSSIADFQKRMPYFSFDQVRRALEKLKKNGYISAQKRTVGQYSTMIDNKLISSVVAIMPNLGNNAKPFGKFATNLKEEKENFPPHPPYKEKEEKKMGERDVESKRAYVGVNSKKETFERQVLNDTIKRQGIMKLLGIRDENEFLILAEETLQEWELTEVGDWSWHHLIKQIRIKKEQHERKKRNTANRKSEQERYAEYEAYLRSDTEL